MTKQEFIDQYVPEDSEISHETFMDNDGSLSVDIVRHGIAGEFWMNTGGNITGWNVNITVDEILSLETKPEEWDGFDLECIIGELNDVLEHLQHHIDKGKPATVAKKHKKQGRLLAAITKIRSWEWSE